MNTITTLASLDVGQQAIVTEILAKGSIRRRFFDLGIIEGTVIECMLKSPAKDPIAFQIRGATIALRQEDSSNIYVNVLP